ncbi:CD225/dispanin family protein [Apibacter sp. HY039]|uniref:CD225/dispanin family protein n=1 Tax=Apibacter sp. HY039 TaxID=2501476 RepID=UPI000FEB8C5D|nr:CD225/dispanin family protein [Apibacter sp. HY039]
MDSNFNDSQQSQFNQETVPDNNLVWAILCTVLCCLPFGIYAIICSTKVNKLWLEGDYEGAKKASADAKKWSIYGAVVGVIFMILYFIFMMVVGVSSFSRGY